VAEDKLLKLSDLIDRVAVKPSTNKMISTDH